MMSCTMRDARGAASTLLLLATTGAAGCNLTDVSNPTRLEERDVADPTGADLMRRNALREFFVNAGEAASLAGIFSDEYYVFSVDVFSGDPDPLDLRLEGTPAPVVYSGWQELRHAATLALRQLDANAGEPQRAPHMGQMFAVRAYAVLRLGEDFCPGFPLHGLNGFTAVYGPPLKTTSEVLERALVDLDSAVVLTADSVRFLQFARVVRGRTLLGLERFAEAAAAVDAVPTGYVFSAEYGDGSTEFSNPLFRLTEPGGFGPSGSVSDREGDNGLDFVSAGDPRLTTNIGETVDGTPRYRTSKYPDHNAPMVLASGVEARLIEAEAALEAENPSWLDILNSLRVTQMAPPMPPLADPGSAAARVDLLFRERAFWLFGTGQRLSDLRRLIRQHDRSSETVFPSGMHAAAAQLYGPATSMEFPWELEAGLNPAVTGCTGP